MKKFAIGHPQNDLIRKGNIFDSYEQAEIVLKQDEENYILNFPREEEANLQQLEKDSKKYEHLKIGGEKFPEFVEKYKLCNSFEQKQILLRDYFNAMNFVEEIEVNECVDTCKNRYYKLQEEKATAKPIYVKKELSGQLWEECRCGEEPIYMSHGCCATCAKKYM